jgi:hypothetical protein
MLVPIETHKLEVELKRLYDEFGWELVSTYQIAAYLVGVFRG